MFLKSSSYSSYSLACLIKRVEKLAATCILFFCCNASAGPLPAQDIASAERLMAGKHWEEAAIIFKKIVKEAPEYQAGHIALARALVYSFRREEALSVLAVLINKETGASRAGLIRRSRVLSRLFLTNESFQAYEEGWSLMQSGKYRLARESLEKALEKETDNVEILTRLGQAMLLDSDFDSAAERLRFARKLNPHEPAIRLWLGRALHQRGELTEAVEELKKAVQELHGSEIAPVWLAEALYVAGQKAAAFKVLDDDIKKQPLKLLSIVTSARLQQQSGSLNKEALWNIKRGLQLVINRFDRYVASECFDSASELGFKLREPAKLRLEVETFIKGVNEQLERFRQNPRES